VFGIVVAVQNAFRLEMHQNDFFYFLKIIFDINISKRFDNIKNKFILSKKKSKFKETRFAPRPKKSFLMLRMG
jgi:hypothetical protein